MLLLPSTTSAINTIAPEANYMLVIKKSSPVTGEIDFLFKNYTTEDRMKKGILCHELRNFVTEQTFGVRLETIIFQGTQQEYLEWYAAQF